MKKISLITIALILVASGVIFYYRSQGNAEKTPVEGSRGTLVKEQIEWTRHYM